MNYFKKDFIKRFKAYKEKLEKEENHSNKEVHYNFIDVLEAALEREKK